MMCPFCHHGETKVIDSRGSQENTIRRRRRCLQCDRRFTTYEKIEESPLKVIKKDDGREPFDREKIRRGLDKACYKRPVSEAEIEAIITQVENELLEDFEREVPSNIIGEMLIEALRERDQIAAFRFVSVYREFDNPKDFAQELEPMLREGRAD